MNEWMNDKWMERLLKKNTTDNLGGRVFILTQQTRYSNLRLFGVRGPNQN